ncbi:hypothetical protein V1477_017851 [Vespula maculifrons]|uniref:Uncharacterized protein n=1 Tax=Vespula maculifrons TaxID=7453 RepID=A0ABD2B0F4_VESMC
MEQRRKTFTQENLTAVIGKDSSRPLRPYFFRPDLTNRSRVIKRLGEPDRGHWKGLVAPCTHIFFSTEENRTGVIGKDSSRPLRPYFFRPDRTNRSRVITEPSYNGLKVTKEKKHFSLTIFFSETIAPRRTGLGSLERARRALYAHIFFVQIGPIGAKTQENRSGVIGKDSSRPLRPYFFLPDWTNRSRVITKNLNGVIGKDSSRPLRPYFFLPHRTNRSRVITHPGEPVWGHWKGLVGPCTHIFFSSRSDQQEPSYNGLKGTKEKNIHLGEPDRGHGKGLVAPSAHIFFSTQENRTGVVGKGSSRPLRPYFFRPDRTNRSRVITENLTGVIGKDSSRPLRPYFFLPDWTNRSRVITKNLNGVVGKDSSRPLRPYIFLPDRTNRSRVITHPGEPVWGHWKGLVGPCTHIFFSSRSDQQEPSYNGLKGTKEKNIKNLNGVIGKDSSRPLRPYFFRPDRTNKSRVITHPGEPVWGRWKGLVGPCTHIFSSSRSDQQEPSYNGLKGTKEKNIHLGEPDRGHGKGLVAPSTHIFFSSRSDQ